MSANIEKLSSLALRLVSLTEDGPCGAIAKANNIPRVRRNRVEAIQIAPRDGRWAEQAKPEDIEVAKRIKAEMTEHYEAIGQMERRIEIAKIVAEIESTRDTITHIAAKAALEAGVIARDLKSGDTA